MKTRFFLLLMSALVAATPVYAQTKSTKGKAKAPQKSSKGNEAQKRPEKSFNGTILYSLADENNKPIIKSQPTKFVNSEKNTNNLTVSTAPIISRNSKMQYFFTDSTCFCDMFGLTLSYNLNNRLLMMGVFTPNNNCYVSERKLCSLPKMNCMLFDKIRDLQLKQNTKEADLLLQKSFVRTDETMEIAGAKTVRYENTLTGTSFWVAEDIWLDCWCAPFWGIMHPVLAFDFSYIVEGTEEVKLHVAATKIIENEADSDLIERFRGGEILPMEEVDEMIRREAEQYK